MGEYDPGDDLMFDENDNQNLNFEDAEFSENTEDSNISIL